MTVISSAGSSYVAPPVTAQSGPPVLPAFTKIQSVALINGTPTLASLTTPNDGKTHQVAVSANVKVISAETGGQVNISYTTQGTVSNLTLLSGTLGGGNQSSTVGTIEVDPGTTVSIVQNSALTAGSATVSATLRLLD